MTKSKHRTNNLVTEMPECSFLIKLIKDNGLINKSSRDSDSIRLIPNDKINFLSNKEFSQYTNPNMKDDLNFS